MTATEPSISVVVPVRNGMPWLPQQLAALARQDWPGHWELVVVDNGSSDDSAAAVHAANNDEVHGRQVTVVDAGGAVGISPARNAGVQAAGGEYVVFCDADDVADPGWLTAAARAFAHGADLIGGRLRLSRLNPVDGVVARVDPTPGRLPTGLGGRPYVVGANFGVRREAYLAVGGCDPAFRGGGDDVDLSWRLAAAGCPPVWVPDAVVDYRLRAGWRPLFRQQRAYARADALLIKRHGSTASAGRRAQIAATEWASLMTRPDALIRGERPRAAYLSALASRTGRLSGSIAHRHFAP